MENKKIKGWIGLALAGVLITAGGCGKGKVSEAGKESQASAFKYSVVSNLVTLDPAKLTDVPTFEVLKNIFGGLVELDEKNQPAPNVAEKWEISADQKTYTFHIRKNAKFNNGREVTAEDVKWSFDRASRKVFASPTAGTFFDDIVGFKEVNDGKTDTISGIKVLNKHTLQMTIKQPRTYFLAKIAYHVADILPKGDVPFDKPISSIKEMIGTAPFKVTEFHSDHLVVMEPNEHYYGHKPTVSKVEVRIVKDPLTGISMYKTGKLDIFRVPVTELTSIKNDAKYKDQLHDYPQASCFWLEMNQKVYKPFADKRVRQAFAMAINRKVIVDEVLQGNVDLAKGILPPGIPGYREKVNELPYDPVKAKQLMTQAGYADTSKLPSLQLVVPAKSSAGQAAAANIVMQLRKVFSGFNISVLSPSWDAYLEKLRHKEIGFRYAGWLADYIDPSNFLSDLFNSKSPMNHIYFSNQKFDQLCDKANGLSDLKEREKLYAEAEDILLQEGSVVPLLYPKDFWLVQKNVSGLKSNLIGFFPFNHVEMK